MDNPLKPGDKVLILRKGQELEATVRTTFNHEVQVRVADGELLWRTVKTARLIAASAAEVEGSQAGQESPPPEVVPDNAGQGTDPADASPLAEPETGETSLPAQTAEQAEQDSAPAPSGRKDKRRHRHPRNR